VKGAKFWRRAVMDPCQEIAFPNCDDFPADYFSRDQLRDVRALELALSSGNFAFVISAFVMRRTCVGGGVVILDCGRLSNVRCLPLGAELQFREILDEVAISVPLVTGGNLPF